MNKVILMIFSFLFFTSHAFAHMTYNCWGQDVNKATQTNAMNSIPPNGEMVVTAFGPTILESCAKAEWPKVPCPMALCAPANPEIGIVTCQNGGMSEDYYTFYNPEVPGAPIGDGMGKTCLMSDGSFGTAVSFNPTE